MNKLSLTQETTAILVAILFLGLGLLAVWITRAVLDIEGDAVFVSVLLIPIVIWVIFSGRLKEIRAPGGLEAKFTDVAKKTVEPSGERIEASIQDPTIVTKAGLSELQGILPGIDESKPIVLTLTLGKTGYYQQEALREYIKALSQRRNFKFVVMVDQENRFAAYIPAWRLAQTLEMWERGNEFIQAINDGRVQDLRRYPGVVTSTISTCATNIEALREMAAQNLEALVVIDADRRLRGVVERQQVLSKLMLAMAT